MVGCEGTYFTMGNDTKIVLRYMGIHAREFGDEANHSNSIVVR